MKFLVAGFGYVGQALGQLLLEAGHEVWALSRRGSRGELDSPRLHVVQADLSEPLDRGLFPDSLDAFFFMPSPGERSEEAYGRVFVRGMTHLLQALPDTRGLMVSSTSVYPQGEGEPVDDTSPAEPTSPTGQRLRQAEELLLGSGAAGSAVLRSSGIYGPGRTRLLSTLVHYPLPAEVADVFTCRIHRQDLARALLFSWEHELSGSLIASDPQPARLKEMSQWARETFASAEQQAVLPRPAQPAKMGRRANRQLRASRLIGAGFEYIYPSYREGYRAILGLD